MTSGLSEHQRDALARYYSLLKSHPQLFSGRPRRPIVREPEILEAFSEEHQIVLGVLAETPYLWLINDLVRSGDSSSAVFVHPYLRFIAPPQAMAGPGVVVLATVQTDETE